MIFTVLNQKGGVGKTTTAAAIAQAAAYTGKRVLAVDMDAQANLTYCLAADARRPGAYELLNGAPAAEVIQRSRQGIDVISASLDLQTEQTRAGSALRLEQALAPIKKKYSVIVIDTPPSPGELQYNSLMATDRLVIPLEADAYNVQSLYQIAATVDHIKRTNVMLQIAGVLLTKYDGRSTLSKTLCARLEETAAALGIPFLGTVRKAIAVSEAAAFQESLFEYAPKSKPAADYMRIYETITRQ